ncbi:MAG: SLOG family protein [Neglectibacter timonensis]
MGKSMRAQTCCFTGHRDVPTELKPYIAKRLERILRNLIGEGIRYFGSGGARGFDLMAEDAMLQLKREFPLIRLIMVLPCRDQPRGWRGEDLRHYERVLSQADKVVYVQGEYTPGCMQKRNRHLVDNSSVCVAYCTRRYGGTSYTVEYADRKNVKVIEVCQTSLFWLELAGII